MRVAHLHHCISPLSMDNSWLNVHLILVVGQFMVESSAPSQWPFIEEYVGLGESSAPSLLHFTPLYDNSWLSVHLSFVVGPCMVESSALSQWFFFRECVGLGESSAPSSLYFAPLYGPYMVECTLNLCRWAIHGCVYRVFAVVFH